MKHEELVEFITNRMSMQHIYQPLLIKTLVECGGSATVRQIAQSVLSNDESQLHYYEQRIKQMPVEVLKKHGVLERDGELVSLNLKKMSLKEKSELLMLCEQKMREFIQDNDDIWDSRFATAPVSTGVRYEVLKRANKRCALCGVQEGDEGYEDRLPLHIDHIEPRSKGGSNEIDNLQVLCRACNKKSLFWRGLNSCPWAELCTAFAIYCDIRQASLGYNANIIMDTLGLCQDHDYKA